MNNKNKYTCNEYREEMILLSLQRRLNSKNISEKEKAEILMEIELLETKMGIN